MKSSKFFIIYFTIFLFIFSNSVFAATATTNYKFDDETYADIPGEVIDSIGTLNAVAQFAQPVEGKVCQAVDLTRTSVDDFVELPVDVLENKTSFSIAAWFKTSTKNQQQAIISGGNSYSTDNEVLLLLQAETSSDKGITFFREGSSVRFDYPSGITTLADDQWHHIAISSGAGRACLYLDGDRVSCKNQNTGVIDLSQLVLGQELDDASVISLSRDKTVTQSSGRGRIASSFRPELAIDRNTNGDSTQGSVSSTAASEFEAERTAEPPLGGFPALNQPWWQVDLGVQHDLSEVVVWSPINGSGGATLGDFYLIVSEQDLTGQSLSNILALATPDPDNSGVSPKVYTQLIRGNTSIVNKEISLTEVYGRFVRIQLTSDNTALRLAEVEVFGEENIAENQSASQSSKFNPGLVNMFLPGEAVDGNTFGVASGISSSLISSSHTANDDFSPWWQVDLSTTIPSHNNISKIRLWNRTDCCQSRLSEFFIFISDNDMSTRTLDDLLDDSTVYKQYVDSLNGEDNIVLSQGNVQGRYVKIQRIEHTTEEHLTLAEVQVFGTIVLDGTDDNQSFIGLMDEVVIYDGVVTPSEIKQLYDFQNSSLDLDGTPIDCSIAVAQYHFEDEVWNGTSDEVADYSGNDLHGVAVSNVSPAVYSELFTESDDPALSGDPGTCGYAGFASSNQQYLEIPNNELLNPDGNFSIAAWVRPTGGQGTFRAVLSSRLTFDGVRQGFVLYADKNDKWSIWTATGEGFFHQGISNASVILNEWVHITVTFKSEYQVGDVHFGTKSIYINGDIDNPAYSESNVPYIANRETPFLIGAANEGTASNHTTSFYFDGEIDEAQVYQFHLLPETVQQVFNERHPCALPIPRANYRFDECGYTGTGNEVLDQSRLLGNGTSVFSGSVPNLSTFVTDGEPDAQEATILRSGVVNHSLDLSFNNEEGKADWAQLPSTVLNGVNDFSISLWLNTTADARRFIQALGSDVETDEVEIAVRDAQRLLVIVKNNRLFLNSSISMTDGLWHHIVITRHDNLACLYVDGIFQQCDNDVGAGILSVTDANAIVLGQDQTIFGGGFNPGQNFIGQMDELMIFDSVLTGEAISTIYTNQQAGNNYDGSTRAAIECIHHYEIEHDGNGLTCEAEEVTIKACSNAACTLVDTEPTSLNFNITNPSGATSTVASPTFTGSIDLSFNHTIEELLALSISDASVTPSSSLRCSGSNRGCNMLFLGTDFRFGYLSGTTFNRVPTQISGKDSNIEPSTGAVSTDDEYNLVLQAISTSDTGECEAVLNDNREIELAFECVNPQTCRNDPTTPVTINGSAVSANNFASINNYTSVMLDFGDETSNSATININYPDAGLIRLHARYRQTLDDDSTNLIESRAAAPPFLVKPAGLCVEATEDTSACSAGDHTCTRFKKAGENFNFNVKTVGWETHGESNDDFCVGNNTTPNFRLNFIALTPNLVTPEGGNNATLFDTSVNINLPNKGESPVVQRVSEVGVFTITATAPSYFSETIAASTSANIGRFTPDHFIVSAVEQGTIVNQNNSRANFVYTGETLNTSSAVGAISYGIQPEILITAENAAGATTENYTGNFMMLDVDGIMTTEPATDATMSGAVGTLTGLMPEINTGAISGASGIISYTYSANDHYVYTRDENSLIDEYIPDINLVINSISDADSVVAQDSDGTGVNDPAGIITLHPQPTATGLMVRFGRWIIENTFGPDTSPLPLPMSLQYWNGSQFITNADDSLTQYNGNIPANISSSVATNIPNIVNLTTPLSSTNLVNVSGAGPTFVSGEGNLMLSAPGAGNPGQIRITYNTVPTWLLYDWDGVSGAAGTIYDDNPSGIATFGMFRGNDRIISWRELNE